MPPAHEGLLRVLQVPLIAIADDSVLEVAEIYAWLYGNDLAGQDLWITWIALDEQRLDTILHLFAGADPP